MIVGENLWQKKSRARRIKEGTKTSLPTVTTPAKVTTPRSSGAVVKRGIDYVKDYYYVYNDMRTMLIITILMIAVMVGLTFVF